MHKNTIKSDLIVKLLSEKIRTKKDMHNFVNDILSPGEINDIYDRLKIISELANDQTQREVSKKLHVSISKVTRAANVLKYGSGIFYKLFKSKNI